MYLYSADWVLVIVKIIITQEFYINIGSQYVTSTFFLKTCIKFVRYKNNNDCIVFKLPKQSTYF